VKIDIEQTVNKIKQLGGRIKLKQSATYEDKCRVTRKHCSALGIEVVLEGELE
jgi:hypothetical protein